MRHESVFAEKLILEGYNKLLSAADGFVRLADKVVVKIFGITSLIMISVPPYEASSTLR
jgi:hypothetical protein